MDRQLGQTGKDCFDAILAKDMAAGSLVNQLDELLGAILPKTVKHPPYKSNLRSLVTTNSGRWGYVSQGAERVRTYDIASIATLAGPLKVKVRHAKNWNFEPAINSLISRVPAHEHDGHCGPGISILARKWNYRHLAWWTTSPKSWMCHYSLDLYLSVGHFP